MDKREGFFAQNVRNGHVRRMDGQNRGELRITGGRDGKAKSIAAIGRTDPTPAAMLIRQVRRFVGPSLRFQAGRNADLGSVRLQRFFGPVFEVRNGQQTQHGYADQRDEQRAAEIVDGHDEQ